MSRLEHREPSSFNVSLFMVLQVGHKEFHSDSDGLEDLGPQPCAKAPTQGLGHGSLRTSTK